MTPPRRNSASYAVRRRLRASHLIAADPDPIGQRDLPIGVELPSERQIWVGGLREIL